MAENSKIEWCDHTFNPWIGCTKVSEGCKNCYAETLMDHRYGKAKWGPQGQRVRTSEANWRKPLQWDRKAGKDGRRYRVFCASLADVFEDNDQLLPWRVDLFRLIEKTPHLDWLLLTKRPENVIKMIERTQEGAGVLPSARAWLTRFSNVWIGASAENQEQYDRRIVHMMQIPARYRFLSCEPLLSPIDMGLGWQYVNWVIVGGESGPNARPMHPDWVRSIRDQCANAGVPFFFKQWGEWLDQDVMTDEQYGMVADLDPDAIGGVSRFKCNSFLFPMCSDQGPSLVYRIGKARAGRLLDGVEHNAYPKSATIESEAFS